jgi:ribosomal protein L10
MKAKAKAKKSDKQHLVDSLSTKLGSAQALFYTDFTGLNVKRMTDLRRRLKKAGVEYVVIKNTLALRAVNESGLVSQRLKGPTGVVVAKDGPRRSAVDLRWLPQQHPDDVCPRPRRPQDAARRLQLSPQAFA